MAELGVIASIVGLLGLGARLSVTIFDFASSVGSAEYDLYAMGKEVSLFCAVLEQLQRLLRNKSSNFSPNAIDTVKNIADHCTEILDEIESLIEGLVEKRGPDLFPSMDFVNKVKWTFKRPKVQVLRSALESCKLTLNVMLTTFEVARKVSSTSPSEFSSAEIAQEKLLVQSLYLSQQATIQQVGELEKESETASRFKVLGRDIASTNSVFQDHSRDSALTRLPSKSPTRGQRASIWLQALLPGDNSLTEEHPGSKYRRLSSYDASVRSAELIDWWTMTRPASQETLCERLPALSTKSPFAMDDKGTNNGDPILGRAPTDLVSPTTAATGNPISYLDGPYEQLDSPGSPRTAVPGPLNDTVPASKEVSNYIQDGFNGAMPLAIDIRASNSDLQLQNSKTAVDHVRGLLNIGNSNAMSLAIVYGGKLRDLEDNEKPLELLGQLKGLGLDPFLVLKTGITSKEVAE